MGDVSNFLNRLKTRISQVVPVGKPIDKFQRAWDTILFECKLETNLTREIHDTDIPASLKTMVDLLVREAALVSEPGSVEEGGCAELFLNTDMLGHLIRISESDIPEGFRGEVIHFLSSFIGLLDGKILIQNAIHRPTLYLLRKSLSDRTSMRYEEEMLELAYNIASKMQELPVLLEVFFTTNYIPRNVTVESAAAGLAMAPQTPNRAAVLAAKPTLEPMSPVPMSREGSTTSLIAPNGQKFQVTTAQKPEFEFLLFEHFMRCIHLAGRHGDSEARRGDFARTACLIILEFVHPQSDLEIYILQSDFPRMVDAGLGGLYAQLPARLPAGYNSFGSNSNVTNSFALSSFREDLDSFLQLWMFAQDVFTRCPSTAIRDALISKLSSSFFNLIVHPSIQGASDFDGSTVATFFYLQEMVRTATESDELSKLLCEFLMGSEEDDAGLTEWAEGIDEKGERVRKDEAGEAEPHLDEENSEFRLHVRDILLSKLNSLSEEVVTATLRLIHSLLSQQSHNALHLIIEKLPRTQEDGSSGLKLDIQQHLAIVSKYFAMLPPDQMDGETPQSLESYIHDAADMLAAHNRSNQSFRTPSVLVSSPTAKSASPLSPAAPGNVHNAENFKDQMRAIGSDSTLRKLLIKFSTFFSHSYQINLALTGVLSQLASEPEPLLYMYLFSAESFLDPPSGLPKEVESRSSRDGTAPSNAAEVHETDYRSFYSILVQLMHEIDKKKESFPDFASSLAKTREMLYSGKFERPNPPSFFGQALGFGGGGAGSRKSMRLSRVEPKRKPVEIEAAVDESASASRYATAPDATSASDPHRGEPGMSTHLPAETQPEIAANENQDGSGDSSYAIVKATEGSTTNASSTTVPSDSDAVDDLATATSATALAVRRFFSGVLNGSFQQQQPGGSGRRSVMRPPRSTSTRYAEDFAGVVVPNIQSAAVVLDLEGEFLKNVVILEEAIKELLAIIIAHAASDHDQITYI
ncbi:Retinoic acid induced 16-like protein-domain-containing protein [Cladochytrium replicatum]|nr:Retinoic acid induced 16-like protein-domain-containing protein [Cladochytrium replicatum]